MRQGNSRESLSILHSIFDQASLSDIRWFFNILVGLVSNFKFKVLHLICGLSYILLTITVSMEQYLYKADQRAKWVIWTLIRA